MSYRRVIYHTEHHRIIINEGKGKTLFAQIYVISDVKFCIGRDARIYLMTTNDINNTRYCGTLIVVGRRAHACRSPGLITAARSCSNLVTSLPISRVHRAEWKFISFVSLYDRSVGSYWNFEEISRLSRSILNDLYREQNFHFD